VSKDLSMAQRRAEIARAQKDVRRNPSDGAARARVRELKAEYAERQIENYVQAVVASAPPLSAEQLERIAILLRPEAA
jgi:hypothetical protein